MTATDELRRMLDERGVEWETDRSGNRVMWGRPVDQLHDTMEFKAVDNAMPNGGLNVHICGFTPEQAIEATLGRGTCRDLAETPKYGDKTRFECSACSYEYSAVGGFGCDYGDEPDFRYCPNCGREVVEQ